MHAFRRQTKFYLFRPLYHFLPAVLALLFPPLLILLSPPKPAKNPSQSGQVLPKVPPPSRPFRPPLRGTQIPLLAVSSHFQPTDPAPPFPSLCFSPDSNLPPPCGPFPLFCPPTHPPTAPPPPTSPPRHQFFTPFFTPHFRSFL